MSSNLSAQCNLNQLHIQICNTGLGNFIYHNSVTSSKFRISLVLLQSPKIHILSTKAKGVPLNT